MAQHLRLSTLGPGFESRLLCHLIQGDFRVQTLKYNPTIGILCALCASYTEHSFIHSDVIVKGAVNSDATAFYSSNFLLSPFAPFGLTCSVGNTEFNFHFQNKLVHASLFIFICFEACIVHTYKVIVLSMHLLKDRTPHSLD